MPHNSKQLCPLIIPTSSLGISPWGLWPWYLSPSYLSCAAYLCSKGSLFYEVHHISVQLPTLAPESVPCDNCRMTLCFLVSCYNRTSPKIQASHDIDSESVLNNIHCTHCPSRRPVSSLEQFNMIFISEVQPAAESSHHYPVFALHKGNLMTSWICVCSLWWFTLCSFKKRFQDF